MSIKTAENLIGCIRKWEECASERGTEERKKSK